MRPFPLAVAAVVTASVALAGCFQVGPRAVDPEDLITDMTYTRWVVEVDYAQGEQPSASLLSFVRSRLAPLVDKEAVEFRLGQALAGTDRSWSDAEVRAFAGQNRDLRTDGDTVVTHLLFLAGHSASDQGDRRVLGAAYGHDLIVVFSRSIERSCEAMLVTVLCRPEPYFQAVLVHEYGHALGLVNNGTPMVRDHEADTCGDQPDRGHSSNQRSVMFCQVETSAIFLPPFQNGPPTDFDDDDRADLRAAGSRALRKP